VNQTAQSILPLAIGPNERHFVDQLGVPILIQGDAAWSLIAATTRDQAELYLDDTVAKGFTAIIVNLLEMYWSPDPPRNVFGHDPFRTPNDFATPNEPYFEHADWVLAEAGRRGLIVFLAPTYLGHPDPFYYGERFRPDTPEGYYEVVLENGVEKCRDFGRWLGERYRSFDNIVWTIGGDRNPDEAIEHMRAMAAGIGQADPRHLFSAHVLPESSPFDSYTDDPWLDINFTYSYHLVHFKVLREYSRRPPRPNIMIESSYEFEHNASDVQIRRQAYWSVLCGAAGQFMGTKDVWDFGPGWESQLNSPGRTAQRHLHDLFARYRWWDLVPDLSRGREYRAEQDDTLRPFVTEGVGELRGLEFCSAARTMDGRLAMAYLPSAWTITVDLTQMHGPLVDARWFDPGTGKEEFAGLWPVDATAKFTPRAPHDWVLILETHD
jgi:Protein of unknown function (DUF4038)/Putative collagen-binding domain of a collagenase